MLVAFAQSAPRPRYVSDSPSRQRAEQEGETGLGPARRIRESRPSDLFPVGAVMVIDAP